MFDFKVNWNNHDRDWKNYEFIFSCDVFVAVSRRGIFKKLYKYLRKPWPKQAYDYLL